MKKLLKKLLRENLVLKNDAQNHQIVVVSDEKDERLASKETFKNKDILKAAGFSWKSDIKAWVTKSSDFQIAKKTIDGINKSESFISKVEDLEEYMRNSNGFDGKNNLMSKLTQYIDDLSNVVDEATMSSEIRRYLTFFANFKGHSFSNTILIYIQRPTASRVAGFKQWQEKFNRRVVKGAKGIMIFAPIFSKKDAEQEKEEGLDQEVSRRSPVNFRPVYVYDIADTEPIDERGEIPETPEWFLQSEPTERTIELNTYLKEAINDMGIKITTDAPRDGEKGSASGNHINMTSTVEGAGEFSTLVHEFAHELMHFRTSSIYYQGDEVKTDKNIKELQAESVAYVVMKHYDLPVRHQPTYIALWKGNKEKIQNNLRVISDVAKFIIDSIESVAKQKSIE